MPADYVKPEYKSNADKYREAEKADKPRERPTDSDYTRTPQPKKKVKKPR